MKKNPIAGKGDNVKLVFSNSSRIEDGNKTIITLKIEDKPLSLHSPYFSYRTSFAYLDTESILSLMALNLCFLQIDYRDDDPVLLEVGNTIASIDTVEQLQYRIKVFTRQFTEILEVIGINWQKVLIQEAKKSSKCYVYLMKDLTNGTYKIGMSNNPNCREKTLQSEKPQIELICSKKYPTRDIAKAIESSLHSTYSSAHIRGEWFTLSEQDVKDIVETLS